MDRKLNWIMILDSVREDNMVEGIQEVRWRMSSKEITITRREGTINQKINLLINTSKIFTNFTPIFIFNMFSVPPYFFDVRRYVYI